MADCRIVNASMSGAVERIGGAQEGALEGIAKSYQDAGTAFIEALKSAISTMEGETKDALLTFFEKSVEPFVTEDLPKAINSTSVLLEANRKNFEDVDKQLAESISSSGK